MHWMFCPECGKHWELEIGMGGWLITHCDCDAYLLFCNVGAHDLFTIDAHQLVPWAEEDVMRYRVTPSESSRSSTPLPRRRSVRQAQRRLVGL